MFKVSNNRVVNGPHRRVRGALSLHLRGHVRGKRGSDYSRHGFHMRVELRFHERFRIEYIRCEALHDPPLEGRECAPTQHLPWTHHIF